MKTDLSYLLSMSDGDKHIINELIDIFAIQVKEMAGEMLKLESERNYEELSKLAHKAKSSVAIMGIKNLAYDLKELELLCKDKEKTETYRDFILQFREETEEAIVELENYKQKNSQ